jgi:hypothetical protein
LVIRYGKERVLIFVAVILTIICTLWIAHSTPQEEGPSELGVSIPPGQLVVPIELANASALNSLVMRTAVIDVFKPGEQSPLVEGLRVLKLSSGEGPLFGALVPEKVAGSLQEIFSNAKLRAAIRTSHTGPAQFHIHTKIKSTLLEVPIGD